MSLTLDQVLDPLNSAANFAPGRNAHLSTVPDVPPDCDRSGAALQVTISALAGGTDSTSVKKLALDLSASAARQAVFSVWCKALSLEHLAAVYVLFGFPGDGYAAYRIMPAAAGAWTKFTIPIASPSSARGVDWSNVTLLVLRVDAASDARFTGRVRLYDLRVIEARP